MSQQPHGLGRIHVPDERDRDYLMAAHMVAEPVVAPLPDHITYSAHAPLDQGGTPECVAYASRGWLYAGRVINRGGPAPGELYDAAQARDGIPMPHDGTTVRAAMQVLQSLGYIDAYLWAYGVENLSQWMREGRGPCVIGVPWYDSLFDPDRHGRIRIAPGARVVGGHAVLVIGVNERDARARILNSWGPAWGQHGRAWISYEDLDRLLREDGEAATALERRVA